MICLFRLFCSSAGSSASFCLNCTLSFVIFILFIIFCSLLLACLWNKEMQINGLFNKPLVSYSFQWYRNITCHWLKYQYDLPSKICPKSSFTAYIQENNKYVWNPSRNTTKKFEWNSKLPRSYDFIVGYCRACATVSSLRLFFNTPFLDCINRCSEEQKHFPGSTMLKVIIVQPYSKTALRNMAKIAPERA